MTKAVRLHPAAAEELWAAVAWYEERQPGLGIEFHTAVSNLIERLEVGRLPGSPVPLIERRKLRRAIMKRFPFSIAFMDRGEEIVVLAFAHQRRRPGYWRARAIR